MGGNDTGGVIIPCLRYRDAHAAIRWLCATFGFREHLVIDGERNSIAHAQLTFGNGMVMLGSEREDVFDNLQKLRAQVGGVATQSSYIVVDDVDAHHDRAVASGAEVVYPLTDEDHGGRAYSCRDLEGHIWNFGSYNPWKIAER